MDENRLEGAAREVGGKVESVVGAVTGDPKAKAQGYVDDTYGQAQQAYGKIKDTAGQYADQAADFGSQLLDQIEDAGDYIAEQVDQRPVTAVLIAAAVGFLIALVTKPSPKVVYRRR